MLLLHMHWQRRIAFALQLESSMADECVAFKFKIFSRNPGEIIFGRIRCARFFFAPPLAP